MVACIVHCVRRPVDFFHELDKHDLQRKVTVYQTGKKAFHYFWTSCYKISAYAF